MSFYKHHSGYQKRKLKEEKAFSNTQVISKFFKPKESEKKHTLLKLYQLKMKI